MTEPAGKLVPMFEQPQQPAPDATSWDEYWRQVKGEATQTIRGVVVRVPTGITLGTQQHLETLADATGVAGFEPVASELFRAPDGSLIPDLWQRWCDAGMELDELTAVVAWGMAHAKGHPISLAEAAREAKEAAAGKDRAAGTKRSSGGTGGRSKPGSPRTASPRTRSRT